MILYHISRCCLDATTVKMNVNNEICKTKMKEAVIHWRYEYREISNFSSWKLSTPCWQSINKKKNSTAMYSNIRIFIVEDSMLWYMSKEQFYFARCRNRSGCQSISICCFSNSEEAVFTLTTFQDNSASERMSHNFDNFFGTQARLVEKVIKISAWCTTSNDSLNKSVKHPIIL